MNKLPKNIQVWILILILTLPLSVNAQKRDTIPSPRSVIEITNHSPHKATIYSAILPGLGQVYNKRLWKVPILYAGIGVTLYALRWNNKQLRRYRNAFGDFTAFSNWKYQDPDADPQIPRPTNDSYTDILNWDFETSDSRFDSWFQTQLKNRKDSFKHDRDLSYIILAGIYVLNIIDATVDAHFFNFNVNNNLSVKVEPEVDYIANKGNVMELKCSINF